MRSSLSTHRTPVLARPGQGRSPSFWRLRSTRRPADEHSKMFSESWEVAVPKVIEAYKVTSTLCETGAGTSDISSAAYCTAS
jgi:hypothetical protein